MRLAEPTYQGAADEPEARDRRLKGGRRAGRAREERVAAALDELAERERCDKTNKKPVAGQKEPRASTTDPEARVLKMANGGFGRPGSQAAVHELHRGAPCTVNLVLLFRRSYSGWH